MNATISDAGREIRDLIALVVLGAVPLMLGVFSVIAGGTVHLGAAVRWPT
jgi:hypothetical protein